MPRLRTKQALQPRADQRDERSISHQSVVIPEHLGERHLRIIYFSSIATFSRPKRGKA
jgi:hypothetical protein